jgi:branched-chain amino acid aminotransferase
MDRGADEAIMCNTSGVLCEGSASNIFLEVDGQLCTPALATGCLPGVTRDLLLDCISVSERDDLTLDDLRRSREVFLTSGTRDVHPLAALDGIAPAEVPGPLTTAAAAAYAELVSSNPDP